MGRGYRIAITIFQLLTGLLALIVFFKELTGFRETTTLIVSGLLMLEGFALGINGIYNMYSKH